MQKAARSAAEAGWEVILLGRSPDSQPQTWASGRPGSGCSRAGAAGQAAARVPPALAAGAPAYPPTGIADHRAGGPGLAGRSRRPPGRTDQPPAATRARAAADRAGPALAARNAASGLLGHWVSFRAWQLRGGQQASDGSTRRGTGPTRGSGRRRWASGRGGGWSQVSGTTSWPSVRSIDELRPDLIHAHDFRMLGVGARAADPRRRRRRGRSSWSGTPTSTCPVSSRGATTPGGCPPIAHEREYAPTRTPSMTVSDGLADLLQRGHGLRRRPAVVLNAPLDGSPPTRAPAPDLRAVCGIDAASPLLVYSGVDRAQTWLDVMVEALPRLAGVHVALVAPKPGADVRTGADARASRARRGRTVSRPAVRPHDQVVAVLSQRRRRASSRSSTGPTTRSR